MIDGRSIRFTATGEEAYALDGVAQGEVDVVIAIGGTSFCGSFGGTITRDDGQRFVARRAPAPAVCPGASATTTSTSTTSTTSTTIACIASSVFGPVCSENAQCCSGTVPAPTSVV